MTKRTTQSKTVAGRLFDVARVQDYEAAIARLRASNKKLRAELACAQRGYNAIKSASLSNWETAERYRRDVAEAMKIIDTLKEAFSTLAEAIGGKAK